MSRPNAVRFFPLWFGCALVGTLAALSAQQATFRTDTKTVPVYVTVTDADGRLVPDLRRDDFEILDNGRPEEVTVFANEIQPITVVLLLDRSRSMALNFRREREAAEEFVSRLMAADKARIGSFSWEVQIHPAEFTSDHAMLVGILNSDLQDAGPTPLWHAVDEGMTALRDQQGRRVVLVFTDGADEPGGYVDSNTSLKDVMKRAREEDVMVYAVGLAGRVPVTTVLPPMGGIGGIGGILGGRGRGRPGGTGGRTRTGSIEVKPDKGLVKIAAESGGGYFELKSADDLGSTFTRVAEELHHQYALGFTPAALDGRTHKLEVRVKREAMTARARKSYVASPGR